MSDIPLNAKVQCSDGPRGTTTNVIVNPVSHAVTHIAIRDDTLPKNATRLIPVDQVTSATEGEVTLGCTRDDVAGMKPFVVEHLVQQTMSGGTGGTFVSPFVFNDTGYLGVKEEDVPKGALSVVSGMEIHASDGVAGKLSELVLDEKSGQITHLKMREGHLWNKKDVAIPITDVSFVDSDTVHLRIHKDAIGALPAVKVRRP